MYVGEQLSAVQIAERAGCSAQGINHRLKGMGVVKRNIGEAVYVRHNPGGDPFKFTQPESAEDCRLFGLGLGLYWGEGNKANPNAVRLGNSDPRLLKSFMKFVEKFFGVSRSLARVQLQIFPDLESESVERFWETQLGVPAAQFYKTFVTERRGQGTYRHRSRYGVATVSYHNVKLRNLMLACLERQASEFGEPAELLYQRQAGTGAIAQKP